MLLHSIKYKYALPHNELQSVVDGDPNDSYFNKQLMKVH